jgi:hypothetical protein
MVLRCWLIRDSGNADGLPPITSERPRRIATLVGLGSGVGDS